jgi:hypothetical protein
MNKLKRLLKLLSGVAVSVMLVIMYIASVVIIFPLQADATGQNLKTAVAHEVDAKVTYTLYLYGSRYLDDPETAAILMKEPLQHTVEIYAPDFNFKIVKGTSSEEAIGRALGFVSRHSAYDGNIISAIYDQQGIVIGYEMRPLYQIITYGMLNVLDVDYRQKGDKITVYIKLKPLVEKMLKDGDGSRGHGK